MDGENSCTPALRISGIGSSPPGRGKLSFTANLLDLCRLIPARAGKTSHGPDHRLASTAHPRAGGENADRAIARAIAPRLIPARAGKTVPAGRSCERHKAHPRAGGENPTRKHTATSHPGSSPRGRGKLEVVSYVRIVVGLIPARAGKTITRTSSRSRRRAHPRAGGENVSWSSSPGSVSGSSPHGRGKLEVVSYVRIVVGLIPARAGKTVPSQCKTCPRRAHPRAGGENRLARARGPASSGSSPRGRGKLVSKLRCAFNNGLIPARAGKTSSISPTSWPTWAHPRAGGENRKRRRFSHPWPGSSPRGRGKPYEETHGYVASRLIPARAGENAGSVR